MMKSKLDKILIVDDNVDFLSLMVKVLKPNFEVHTATTAMDALALINLNKDYKALILDMSLPDYTAFYLGTAVRKENATIPIAVLTNYDGEITKDNIEKINAEYWKKPEVVNNLKFLPEKIRKLYV